MKAIIISLVTLVILLSNLTIVSAGGDQVRGGKGEGTVAQNCVNANTVNPFCK